MILMSIEKNIHKYGGNYLFLKLEYEHIIKTSCIIVSKKSPLPNSHYRLRSTSTNPAKNARRSITKPIWYSAIDVRMLIIFGVSISAQSQEIHGSAQLVKSMLLS